MMLLPEVHHFMNQRGECFLHRPIQKVLEQFIAISAVRSRAADLQKRSGE